MALSPRAEGKSLRRPQPCSLVPTAAFLKHNLLLGTHAVQKQASSQIHKCRISKVLLTAFSPLEGRGLRTWGSDVFFETPPEEMKSLWVVSPSACRVSFMFPGREPHGTKHNYYYYFFISSSSYKGFFQ